MQELDDSALLREYAERDSGEAFALLVTRHVNKVYSVALRHTGNPHSAEEITQAVFVILARKARQLCRHAFLSGWLHETARLTSVTFIRGEIRRSNREQEAHMQTLLNETGPDAWPQIAPLLDAAMSGLGEKDRHALVLRYFDGKSTREVGTALGTNEEAAKKRVSRAVEKLRKFFNRRGIALSAAVIAGTVSANSVSAAPAGLAKAISALAMSKGPAAGVTTLTLVKGTMKMMTWIKIRMAVFMGVGALLAAGAVTVAIPKNKGGYPVDSMTTESFLLNPPIIAKAVFEKRNLNMEPDPDFSEAQTPHRFLVKCDDSNYFVGMSLDGETNVPVSWADGKLDGVFWSYFNTYLTFDDPAINTNRQNMGEEMGAKLTAGLVANLGFPYLNRTNRVLDETNQCILSNGYEGIDDTNDVIQLEYDNGRIVSAVLSTFPTHDGFTMVNYRYDTNFYGGRIPVEFTQSFRTGPGGSYRERVVVRLIELELANQPLPEAELNPTNLFVIAPGHTFFNSNNVPYAIGSAGEVYKIPDGPGVRANNQGDQ